MYRTEMRLRLKCSAGIFVFAVLTLVLLPLADAQTESVLYSFTGPDGYAPFAGLMMDAKGNLYGTTEVGGTGNRGVMFKLTPTGTESVPHSFSGGTEGSDPDFSGVVPDSAGNLYGTTYSSGTYGLGTTFKVTPSGTETVLYSFPGFGSPIYPVAGLIPD